MKYAKTKPIIEEIVAVLREYKQNGKPAPQSRVLSNGQRVTLSLFDVDEADKNYHKLRKKSGDNYIYSLAEQDPNSYRLLYRMGRKYGLAEGFNRAKILQFLNTKFDFLNETIRNIDFRAIRLPPGAFELMAVLDGKPIKGAPGISPQEVERLNGKLYDKFTHAIHRKYLPIIYLLQNNMEALREDVDKLQDTVYSLQDDLGNLETKKAV
jgi:hypothetical protein